MKVARIISFLAILALGVSSRAAEAPFGGEVRFDQRIGEPLPLSVEFTDLAGHRAPLRSFFRGKPVVLYFGYARCVELCSLVGDGTVTALRQIRPEVGKDLDVVAITLDPDESASATAARQSDAIRRYGHPASASGWHFLRGDDAAIHAVANAVGFHYVFDPRSRQYAHPSGFVVVRPDGVISRYFLGADFEAAEVARAINDAARNRSGSRVLDLLLLCFRGEGGGGRYTAVITRVLAGAVLATVLALGGGIAWMLRQERRTRKSREAAA